MEIHVRPNTSKGGVGGSHDGALVVRVAEPAERGRATRAALRALADCLGLPVGAVSLVRGPTSRRKVVEIAVAAEQERAVQSRLERLLRSGS